MSLNFALFWHVQCQLITHLSLVGVGRRSIYTIIGDHVQEGIMHVAPLAPQITIWHYDRREILYDLFTSRGTPTRAVNNVLFTESREFAMSQCPRPLQSSHGTEGIACPTHTLHNISQPVNYVMSRVLVCFSHFEALYIPGS